MKISTRRIAYALIFSFVFSTALVFGHQLEENIYQNGGINIFEIKTWMLIVVLTVVFALISYGIFGVIARYEKSRKIELPNAQKVFYKDKRFWKLCLLFLVCWTPVFLSAFPGYFVYDARAEWEMVSQGQYTTHHPLLHVLLLGSIIEKIHSITGSYNEGIATYIILQMIVIACIFSHIICRMNAWGVSKLIQRVGIVYLCVFPTVIMYVLCSTKDVLFSALLLLALVKVIDYIYGKNAKWKDMLSIVIICALAFLLRHNGIYAFVVTAPFWLIVAQKRKRTAGMLVGIIAIIILYITCSYGLKEVTNAQESGKQEMLSIPIQQMARVYQYDKEGIEQADLEELYAYIPEEALVFYKPVLADNVKQKFNNSYYLEHTSEFWKLWYRVGKSHASIYLKAFMLDNCGYWYPYATLNCYEGNQTRTFVYKDSSYFGYETESPGDRESKIPLLDEAMRKLSLEISWQKVPVIRLLFHPAFYFWLFAFALCYQLYQKRYDLCMIAALILFVYATVLLGPAVLVRYVLYFYFGFPLLLALLLEGRLTESYHYYNI